VSGFIETITLPVSLMFVLTSVIPNFVVLPTASLTGLIPFNLAAYGLPACCPSLKACCYLQTYKDLLPGGCPPFRGGILTRLITRPCPAALELRLLYILERFVDVL
jgi:hypothetical protein